MSCSHSLNVYNFFVLLIQLIAFCGKELETLSLSRNQTRSNSVLSVFPIPLPYIQNNIFKIHDNILSSLVDSQKKKKKDYANLGGIQVSLTSCVYSGKVYIWTTSLSTNYSQWRSYQYNWWSLEIQSLDITWECLL